MDAHVGETATTLVLWLWFIGWALALARLDIQEHRLPNRMVAICSAGCVIATLVHAIVIPDITAIVTPAVGSVAAAACFAIGHVTGGIGMGDVKFALVTGWMLGTISWSAVWWGHVAAFVLAGVVVTAGWLLRGWRREHPVPFGPFMGLGVIVAGAVALESVG
ncbi:MAG: prepilin peptidase [Actinomycetota bacterium]